VPAVAIWNYRSDCNLDCIGANNFDAGYQVTQYLIERGHRDIALLFPPVASNDRAWDRMHGALSALKKSHIKISKKRMFETPYDIGAAKQTVKKLLTTNPPGALVCGNDIIAQGAIYACQSSGVNVPEDISIIGIGDFRGSAHMEPALTTLRMPARRIGKEAAEALCLGRFEYSGKEKKRILIPATIIERTSVRNVAG
jgi:LacI family transcriptional regulator